MIIGGNDDDCENLCGGSLPQTFLAHSKVSDLYVPLLENIQYNYVPLLENIQYNNLLSVSYLDTSLIENIVIIIISIFNVTIIFQSKLS